MSEEGHDADVHEMVIHLFLGAPCRGILDKSSPSFSPRAVFMCSDMSVHYVEVEEEERKSVVEEAMDLRKRRQALSHREPTPDLTLVRPIRCLS